jgi:hypothetical protein
MFWDVLPYLPLLSFCRIEYILGVPGVPGTEFRVEFRVHHT